MRKTITAILLTAILLPALANAPVKLTWETLGLVTFSDKYYEDADAYYMFPSFSKEVKALEGQEVYITGYVIPVDAASDFYVLSARPFAECFFCGGAGPETVLELQFGKLPRKFKTDEKLTFKGKFKLNDSDIYHLNYILEGAQIYDLK